MSNLLESLDSDMLTFFRRNMDGLPKTPRTDFVVQSSVQTLEGVRIRTEEPFEHKRVIPQQVLAKGMRVDSVTPNSGPTTGAQSVTIRGRGFNGTDFLINFGVKDALEVHVVNETTITCKTPFNDPGIVDLIVHNNQTGETATLVDAYTFISIPMVTSVVPGSGPIAGGTAVVVHGGGFAAGATVKFGSTAATSVVFVNQNQINCVTPAHAAGMVNVTVQNPSGQFGTLNSAYEYTTGSVGGPIFYFIDPDLIPPNANTQLQIRTQDNHTEYVGTASISVANPFQCIAFVSPSSVTFVAGVATFTAFALLSNPPNPGSFQVLINDPTNTAGPQLVNVSVS